VSATPLPSRTPGPTATATPVAAGNLPSSTPTPQAENKARPEFVQGFPTLSSISTSPATIGTNLGLSMAAFMLILLACSIFNETLEENGPELTALLRPLAGPLGGLFASEREGGGVERSSHSVLKSVLMLSLLGVIYSAVDQNFGFNTSTLALLISLTLALGFVTALFEGGKILLSSRMFRGSAQLRLHPLGIAVAVISVAVSRLITIHPGIILGFVAGAAVAGHDRSQEGKITFIPMVVTFFCSLGALALVGPFREWSNESAEWYAVIPETVAVTVFVSGLEGLVFNLLPITFLEGRTVWDWSRLAWLAVAIPVSFVFFHVVINESYAYKSALEQSSVQVLFGLCALCVVLAGALWLACKLWLPKRSLSAAGHA
jgi:hypothetical protein